MILRCLLADVVTIEKTGEHFRLIYDVKGRFTIHRISDEESKYKLCKVRKTQLGSKQVPFLVTHDGRTIRYPDPIIKANDTIQLDIATGKITDHIKFDSGECKFPPLELNQCEYGRRRIILQSDRFSPASRRPSPYSIQNVMVQKLAQSEIVNSDGRRFVSNSITTTATQHTTFPHFSVHPISL